jgi:hypothetical protein
MDEKLKALHTQAIGAGKWKGTPAALHRAIYWASGVLAYFDALGRDTAPRDEERWIRTREQLHDYDPGLYALIHETFAYAGKVDWRFSN